MDPITSLAFSLANLLVKALQMKADQDAGTPITPEARDALAADTKRLHDEAHALLPGAPPTPGNQP